jgi:hypothetical protein
MKRTLLDEVKRIHQITYGTINEDFFSDIFNTIKGGSPSSKKTDDPKKANFVSNNVDDFFKNLQNAVDKGGLRQQDLGSREYQKEVESMQIGLILLGYDLPVHGVDGYFGTETANAVSKFMQDHQIQGQKQRAGSAFDIVGTHADKPIFGRLDSRKSLSETLGDVVSGGGGNLIGTPGKGTHSADDWQSGNAWDITGNVGSEVKSLTSGTVSKVYKVNGIKKSGGKVIYGDQVTVKSDSGPDVFYTHITSNVNNGDKVSVGSTIGRIMTAGGITPHVHIGLSQGNIKDFTDLKGNIGGGQVVDVTDATPEMLTKEIELLRQRGVKPEEIEMHSDMSPTGADIKSVGGGKFTNLDLNTNEGFTLYSRICQKFIETRKPNPLGITGEMMARSASKVFINPPHRYVPPELALAQLAVEGGIGNPKHNITPVLTRNPFNVGNTSKSKHTFNNVQDGIDAYYKLIANNYLGQNKSANDLINHFVNKDNQNYVGNDSGNYEKMLNSIAIQANRIANSMV